MQFPTRLLLACGLLVASVLVLLSAVTIFRPALAKAPVAQAGPLAAVDVTVAINDFYLDQDVLTVTHGTRVIWTNYGFVDHTVSITGAVSSGAIAPGGTFSYTFNTPGSFYYQCDIHQSMQGRVDVLAASQIPADLSVSLRHDQDVLPGATVDFHVTYNNNEGQNEGEGTYLTVTLPVNSSLLSSARAGLPLTPTHPTSSTLVYSLGTLPSSAENIIDLAVRLTDTLRTGDWVTATASLTAVNPDPNPGDNVAAIGQVVPPAHDLSVWIYDFNFEPQVLTVTRDTLLTWRNYGTVDHDVVITGVASSGVLSASIGSFSYLFTTEGVFPYECTSHPDTMQGVVFVVAPSLVPVDTTVWTNRDQPPIKGALIDYHVDYSNRDANFAAFGALLTVTLPSASTLVSSTSNGLPFSPSLSLSNVVVYNLGTIPAYYASTIDLGVRLDANAMPGDVVELTARLTTTNPDPDDSNNYAQNAEAIQAANMTLSLGPAYDSEPFTPGAILTYSLQYANQSSYLEATSVVITERLPAGLSFLGATREDDLGQAVVTPTLTGGLLTFDMGNIPVWGTGRLLVRTKIGDYIFAGRVMTVSAGATTSSEESDYTDNYMEYADTVLASEPDLWVSFSTYSDGELDGWQEYLVYYGNSGPRDSSLVTVTLVFSSGVNPRDFGDFQPTSVVTSANDLVTAIWSLGPLAAGAYGSPSLWLGGYLGQLGTLTATAAITSTSLEANPLDNSATVVDEVFPLRMPTIGGPSAATVGQTPAFFGLGMPNALVSLYLSATLSLPGSLIGTYTVDDDGRWVISTTVPITPNGWYWFTATQQINGRTSPATGVGNYVNNDLGIDTNSMTVNGERLGGIDQDILWRRGLIYTLGTRITRCADPLTPTMTMRYYDEVGVMTGYRIYTATVNGPGGWVEFEIEMPDDGEFTLDIEYYCPVVSPQAMAATLWPQTKTSGPVPTGLWGDVKKWFGCWESLGCNDNDPPPPPPQPCSGCTPIPRPKPKPKPTDPDGFVYDAAGVRAGATISQSILTNAWVTATRQSAVGQFGSWNALEYSQVNPQFTDSLYPDKVLKPGYYSFIVPPGRYRIQVTAPGFVPYESPTLEVITTPVTLNVPMTRPGSGPTAQSSSLHYLYLPFAARQYP